MKIVGLFFKAVIPLRDWLESRVRGINYQSPNVHTEPHPADLQLWFRIASIVSLSLAIRASL